MTKRFANLVLWPRFSNAGLCASLGYGTQSGDGCFYFRNRWDWAYLNECSVGAIPADDLAQTDSKSCISCMRCHAGV